MKRDNATEKFSRLRRWASEMATLQRPEDEEGREILKDARLVGRSHNEGLVKFYELKDFCRFVIWEHARYGEDAFPRLDTLAEEYGHAIGASVSVRSVQRWLKAATQLGILRDRGSIKGRETVTFEIAEFWEPKPVANAVDSWSADDDVEGETVTDDDVEDDSMFPDGSTFAA